MDANSKGKRKNQPKRIGGVNKNLIRGANDRDIAIIGISCRVPGANDKETFWGNLEQGVNSIQEIPSDRWDVNRYYSPDMSEPNKSVSKWVGLLEGVDRFDNRFFSISPSEALNMDPQQRLLMEGTWHCIEDSGVASRTLQEKKTSVYLAYLNADYRQSVMAGAVDTESFSTMGNFDSFIANRISYTFGFRGISYPINVACASVLTGIHEAKKSLRLGESDYAFVGGINLNLHPWKYLSFSKLRLLSPDGQCKSFDKDANGYVPGDGMCVLLLQRLSDAIRDGNHIYGVIKGTSVNHSGQSISVTAPKIEAQKEVILEAFQDAGMHPKMVSYLEAQGTGTSLGDPIEVESLTRAFREHTDEKQFCKIGVFKTNIGHLEAASGAAAIIKVLMMMKHKKIPKILNLKQANPMIDFENSPFSIATELTEWENPCPGEPLRASINSLSFSGANAHLLLEEYVGEPTQPVTEKSDEHLFMLSAKTVESLAEHVKKWQTFVKSEAYANANLHDLCATLRSGRESFRYRVGKLVRTHKDIAAFLEQAAYEIANREERNWGLRLGPLKWRGAADVKPFMEQSEWFGKRVNELVQLYARQVSARDIQKRFQAEEWAEEDLAIFSMLVGVAVVALYQKNGWTTSLVTGAQSGAWVGLIASGMIRIEDALAVRSGQMMWERVQMARPTIPFLDPVSRSIIQPFSFDETYVRGLVAEDFVAQVDALFPGYVERARLLIESQFTFNRLMDEWNGFVQNAVGNDLYELLQRETFTSQEKQLLLVMILVALQHIADKWNLSDQAALTDTSLQELVHLVSDEVLSKEMTCLLFLSEEPDFTRIAAHLNERQARLDVKRPYKRLRAGSKSVPEIAEVSNWLEQLESVEAPLLNESMDTMEVGQFAEQADEHRRVRVEHLQDALLQLWLKGVAIDWRNIDPEGSFRKVSLPCYHFEHKSFWISPTAVAESSANETISLDVKQEVETLMQIARLEVATAREEVADPYTNEQTKACEPVLRAEPSNDYQKLNRVIAGLFEESLGMERGEVGLNADLREFGMDSVSLTNFVDRINHRLKTELNSSLLYQYTTLQEISEYLTSTFPVVQEEFAATQVVSQSVRRLEAPRQVATLQTRSAPVPTTQKETRNGRRGVAIIGISGRFPGSDNTRQFWEHLVANDDLITEIPQERWDWQAYYGDPNGEENKCVVHWGGFLDDMKGFDANFFKISPKEAEMMDPQQRLTLMEAWHAIEDAGYKPSSLSGSQIGVYIGVCNNDYKEILQQNDVRQNAYTSIGTYFSIIPNRISYQLNLRGPSIAYETACSSSLVAVHQAALAIENGECSQALAGGVNINISPNNYLSFDNAGMLSRDGRCKTFDSLANGYVRGEGVGMILLKDMEQALRDGDHIYGVIKGSAVNHGGYANSLTAPNPNAQAELIVSAWEQSQLPPDSVSYIEVHGTGTKLGDPIEINGLKKAFDDLYKNSGKTRSKTGYIGIGTAKTTIGHLESAAGIAGLIKLLLSMKHQFLTGNIHLKEVNPYVQLEGSPFSIVQQNREWQRLIDDEGREIPRRAGVSSFGVGGTNAHIVLEEYEDPREQVGDLQETTPEIVVLSAKDEERLHANVKELHEYLSRYVIAKPGPQAVQNVLLDIVADVLQIVNDEIDVTEHLSEYGFDMLALNELANRINDRFGSEIVADVIADFSTIEALSTHLLAYGEKIAPPQSIEAVSLADLAYTLQIGREEMEERVAFVVSGIEELADKLLDFSKGRLHDPKTFRSNVKAGSQSSGPLLDGEEGETFVRMVLEKRRLDKIAQLWVMGVSIEWQLLHQEGLKKRISLPGYSFAKRPFWFDSHMKKTAVVKEHRSSKHQKVKREVEIPTTAMTGKVIASDTQLLKARTAQSELNREALKGMVASIVGTVLHLQEDEIQHDVSFKDLGADSISSVELIRQLNKTFELDMNVTVIYDYSDVQSLTAFVEEQVETHTVRQAMPLPWDEPVREKFVETETEEDKIMRLLQCLQDEEIDLDEVDQFLEEIL